MGDEPAPPIAPAAEPAALPATAEGAKAQVEAFLNARGVKTLGKLGVDDLRTLYVQVIGRETGSTDPGYLVWKIREATKGTIPLGATHAQQRRAERPEATADGAPTCGERTPAPEMQVLPIRLPEADVAALDAAWRHHGFKSRMDFLRHALATALIELGETDTARRFGRKATTEAA